MNRSDLQFLAEERTRDARALLHAGRWSGVYYLAGYAVECALKACIARLTQQDDFPDKDRVLKSYTHKIETLVEVAGLKDLRDADVAGNPAFRLNWLIIRDWDESSRYRRSSEAKARELFAAVSDATDGVLPWIKGRW